MLAFTFTQHKKKIVLALVIRASTHYINNVSVNRVRQKMKFVKLNIKVSNHGRERIEQRFNNMVGNVMPIAGYVSRVYKHYDTDTDVASIATTINNKRAVMIVEIATRTLMTVMSEGPVVDAVFNQVMKKVA